MITYDRLAWKRQAVAAKHVEMARKSGDATKVAFALEAFWEIVDANPLYPAGV